MKKISLLLVLVLVISIFAACDATGALQTDSQKQEQVSKTLSQNQSTPTDIDYSLERYNLIKRAYWVNGQRDRARTLPCEIADIPLGYIVLLTESGGVVGKFVVEGKVSSLNSYLTPDSEYYEEDLEQIGSGKGNEWLADVDGSYGYNDDGIFFFTPDGKYIEWTGIYLYSDIPFEVGETVIKVVQTDE